MRDEQTPLNVGPKVSDRQSEADELLKSDAANPDRALFNSDVRPLVGGLRLPVCAILWMPGFFGVGVCCYGPICLNALVVCIE